MSERYSDDADWATAAEQSSEEDEAQEGNVLAADQGGPTFNFVASPLNATMNPVTIGVAGGSQSHSNMSPFLAINFIIALEGIYPSRN